MEDNIKKLEIVTDMAYLNKLLDLFNKNNVGGFTVIKDVLGKGKRGNKDGHGVSTGFHNCYIMMCCEADEVKLIAELVNPYIKKFGGICIVSDAHWVIH